MAEPLEPKELVGFKDLLMSMVWSEEALVTLLEEKGVLTKAEILEKIKELKEAKAKGN